MSTPHALAGTSTERSRSALEALAVSIAAQYFGTDCVGVALHDASAETETADSLSHREVVSTSFTADWTAYEVHQWSKPSYGFPKCHKCNKEKPSTP